MKKKKKKENGLTKRKYKVKRIKENMNKKNKKIARQN
jgi:hypothetical protein